MYMVNFDDLDLNLKNKEELVAKAKALAESANLGNALKQAASLKKAWKRFEDYESASEEELRGKFDAYLATINAKRNELTQNAVETKKALVAKAKEVAEMTNFKQANTAMTELMNQWKVSGSAGKETDDELWSEFSATRKAFFEKKNAYYAELSERFAASKSAKEAIIAKAEELATSTEWKKTTATLNELLEQWKAAGTSGRENDDELWSKFSAARKAFNKAKNEHYSQLRATFEERAAKKEELIKTAKKFVAIGDFSSESVEAVKALRNEWKAVGACDREKEESLWQQFNEAVNLYFQNRRNG